MKVYKLFQAIWVVSIFAFVIVLLLVLNSASASQNAYNTPEHQRLITIWFAAIGVGLASYLLYFFSRINAAKNKHKAFSHATIHGFVGSVGCVAAFIFALVVNPYQPPQVLSDTNSVQTQTPQISTATAPIPTQATGSTRTVTTSSPPKEPLITCTGPDGKTFQTTQKECDEFNKAWGKTQQAPVQIASTKGPTQPTAKLTYPCWDNTYNYYFYTSSGEECNAKNVDSLLWSICTENVKNSGEYKNCTDQCSATHSYESDICYAAYGSSSAYVEDNWDLYMECSSEVSGNFSSCLSACQPLYQKDFDKCYKK